MRVTRQVVLLRVRCSACGSANVGRAKTVPVDGLGDRTWRIEGYRAPA